MLILALIGAVVATADMTCSISCGLKMSNGHLHLKVSTVFLDFRPQRKERGELSGFEVFCWPFWERGGWLGCVVELEVVGEAWWWVREVWCECGVWRREGVGRFIQSVI
jgi:hypothetical protein